MRCHQNKTSARRKTKPGYGPGEALQRRGRLFWWQPFGNGSSRAHGGVAHLAQALAWAAAGALPCIPGRSVRTGLRRVNRP